MDLPLHLNEWHLREPDWPAAAISGLAAGALLMVLELLWALVVGGTGPWRISQLVAALMLDLRQTLHAPDDVFNAPIVLTALATHYALGIVFGMALGVVLASFRVEHNRIGLPALGAVFGCLLYLLDFHLLTRVFPWFIELRGWTTLTAHLVFGLAAAALYRKLARPVRVDWPRGP